MRIIFTQIIFFILSTCAMYGQANCDSWVNLPVRFSAITVGDLDVTGNKITVEASFNMTSPSVNIVSKHWGGFDVNYLLRPVRAEITTDESGFVTTDQGASPCNDNLELNKTYHAALVYDGSTLKFYRNGALISQVPVTGNLKTNDWNTAIGEHAPVVTPLLNGQPSPYYHNQDESQGFFDESFKGFINEVRIWNVARTQDQIKTYMNTSLPDPATQTGLLGYWVFNSLQNLTGNTLYDGTIEGNAVIAQTNTSCNFIADSCGVVLPVKLTDFKVSVFQKSALKLDWNTESESNILDYSIERSQYSDFRNFITLGRVNSSASSKANKYSFIDNELKSNQSYYYRLRINEMTGGISYSPVRSGKINRQVASDLADVYPNPTSENLVKIKFNRSLENVVVNISNTTGQILGTQKINVSEGTVVPLDISKNAKGNYFINIISSNEKIVKRVTKL